MDPSKKEEEIKLQEMITTSGNEKCCVHCKTTKTPLWRSGPSGPKSLCNACGIRHRKRRAAAAGAAAADTASSTLSLNREGEGEKIRNEGEKIRNEGEATKKIKKRVRVRNRKSDKLCMEWRQRLMAFGEGFVLFQKQRSQMKKRQRIHEKLGEVEQAAVLLMSLSCDSVFA